MAEFTIADIRRIDNLPTLPRVVIEVNRLMQNPDVSLQQVGEVIEKDLALAPRILKLVNSSFFGLQAQVASIPRAMVLLGINQVRNAVYAVSVLEAMGGHDSEVQGMWRHGAAVAAVAQYLARQAAPVHRENAFTAGLLHDIGKFIIWHHFPDIYNDGGTAEDSGRHPAGLQRMPMNIRWHAEVGAYLAELWQLPPILRDAIRHHHRPSAAEIDDTLAALVHVADLAVHLINIPAAAVPLDMPDPNLNANFRTWLKNPHQWLGEVNDHIAAAGEFFKKD